MNLKTLRAATPAPARGLPRQDPPPQPPPTARQTAPDNTLAWCLETFSRGPCPAPGNGRNDWLTALALFCNERGVAETDLLAWALGHGPLFTHGKKRITDTIAGVYQRKQTDHSSKSDCHLPEGKFMPGTTVPVASLALPPTFSPALYEALPEYLRRCCQPFEGHEKAVMLLGTLAVLSGCFPGVGGTYNKRRYGLNLFVFIIAPAASGKGTLSWARRLAWPAHKRLTDESRAARADYEVELASYRTSKGKGNPAPPPTGPPPYKLLYLPGNTSAAALAAALAENDGRGIMCETEADTLSGALGTDFGNFSDLLRKAFHHEPVSLLRKTDRQHLDLERPALSIALTGTPGQLPRLMPTAEDGLVSRFLFYTFVQPPAWQDVGPGAGPPLDPIMDALGVELGRMMEQVPTPDEAGNYPTEITLATTDWNRLNTVCAAGLDEAAQIGGQAGVSTAFRLGLIAWRIIGLLTVLRCFEHGQTPVGRLVADYADVSTALALMDFLRGHALAVLDSLQAPNEMGAKGKRSKQAANELIVQELHAQGFSVRDIAKQTGQHFTTVARWVKNIENGV